MKTEIPAYTFPLWLKVSFFALALAKLWLARGQTLHAVGDAGYDDRLFLERACNLLDGNWLGPYNTLTLAKGPFYPIWIAMSFLSGMPLMLSEHLLYIAACVVFAIAIRPFIPKSVTLLAAYAVLLLNPMSYAHHIMDRVIRDGIYPALTILSFAGAIGMLARCESSFKNLLSWSVATGLALSAFWLTREEGVWIIPSILLILISAAVMRWRQSAEHPVRRLLPYVLSFCILLTSVGAVSLINWIKYRSFTTVEITSSDFLSAYGALTRVKHAHWTPRIPVPRETRERIYEVSHKFSELKTYLEGVDRGWLAHSCTEIAVCDDYGGGWFVWAFREAVAAAGYYGSGQSASGYYRDLAAEVNNACVEGKLDCAPERASLMPPWHSEYLRPLVNSFLRASVNLVSFKDFRASSTPSTGSEEQLVLFRDITLGPLSPGLEDRRIVIKGWAFSPDSPINFSVHTANGAPAEFTFSFEERPDVYRHFLAEGKDIPNAMKSGFKITTPCTDCFIYITKDQTLIDRIKIGEKSRQTPQLFFYQDSIVDSAVARSGLPEQLKMDNLRVKYLTRIAKVYQTVAPVFVILALIACTLSGLRAFRRRSITGLHIVQAACISSICMRLFILSMIDVSSFPAIHIVSLASPYPLMLMFLVLSLQTGKVRATLSKAMCVSH